ncbi:MAG: PQQ-binding-like beta-propeller repeat protein [Salinivirgaceae bacterium]|nr:PQQ-binding-like beta-propeller repeat protein [Salinivirgaceae bacterium]
MNSNKQNSLSAKDTKISIIPGLVLATLQWILWFLVPKFSAGGTATMISVFGGLAFGIFIIIWWLFFSRAPKLERFVAVGLMVIFLMIIPEFTHASIKTGLSGLMYYVYAVPVMTISFVLWALAFRKIKGNMRLISMTVTILIATGIWTLFKSDGITGNASAQLKWRWAQSNEQLLLAETESMLSASTESGTFDILWSGFRGNNRDGVVYNTHINTNWSENTPKELWRRPIGSGCGSFAVKGNLLFTQEQRGEEEMVSCYHLESGEPIWQHTDSARFWDSHAGAGPRSTPTLTDSLICSQGATGIVNVMKSIDGSVLWTRNAAEDIQDTIPGWGYCSSPVIVDSILVTAISGTLIAYNLLTGDMLWTGAEGGENYSSPHLASIEGIKQILYSNPKGTTSFEPNTGKVLWERKWEMSAIVQPAITESGDILISEGYKKAIHKISVTKQNENWKIKEHWTSTNIKPDFNDLVTHKGFIYGFEGLSLTCIDLKDGERKWKNGRFGGQIILLADQDLLIVVTEKGKLLLADANPEEFKKLAEIPAIKGKTWNHPVLVKDILLVRNMNEMVAYKLALVTNLSSK